MIIKIIFIILIENYFTEQHHKRFYNLNYGDKNLIVNEKNILATLNNQQAIKMDDEVFIELNCPVFFIYQAYNGKIVLIKNPELKSVEFQCILPPEICFQELAWYLSNFLTPRDNPSQITDDKILCAAKGFDVKQSFRKPPSKS